MESLNVEDITSPKNLSLFFKLSMWWRILYGGLRILLGTHFLYLIGQPLSEPIYALMSHEITGRTGDFVLEKMYYLFEHHDFTVTYFIASYFIFWGIVDIILSWCLLRHIERAFPMTMALISLFILYGIFRFTHTHSLVLLFVLILDIFILFLIHTEYKKFKREHLFQN
jgi:uncharacterized membrane protein